MELTPAEAKKIIPFAETLKKSSRRGFVEAVKDWGFVVRFLDDGSRISLPSDTPPKKRSFVVFEQIRDFDIRRFNAKKLAWRQEEDGEAVKSFKKLLVPSKALGLGEKTLAKLEDFLETVRSQNSYDEEVCLWNVMEGLPGKVFRYVSPRGMVYSITLNQTLLVGNKIVPKAAMEKLRANFELLKGDLLPAYAAYRSWGFGNDDAVLLAKSVSVEEFRKNPYAVSKLYGLAFSKVDVVAGIMGFDRDSAERKEAYVTSLLKSSADTRIPLTEAVEKMKRMGMTGGSEAVVSLGARKSCPFSSDGTDAFLKKDFENESTIARRLAVLATAGEGSPAKYFSGNRKALESVVRKVTKSAPFELDDTQLLAIRDTLASKVSVITGGAGTGKTTILEYVVKGFRIWHSECRPMAKFEEEILFIAPTGNAAARIAEAVGLEAKTIHRALGYSPFSSDEFKHGPENPLPHRIVVIDEISMLDIELARTLFCAVRDDATVVLVGDHNQLPPVGKGDFCRDVLEAKSFSVTKLSKTHRNSWAISETATNVLEGRPDFSDDGKSCKFIDVADREAEDFYLQAVKMSEPRMLAEAASWLEESYGKKLLETIRSVVEEKGIDHVQCLAPTKVGPFGCRFINAFFRELHGVKVKRWCRFAVGERVVQTKNLYDDDEKIGADIMNGFGGKVLETVEDTWAVKVKFESVPEPVWLTRGQSNGLELAYAMSVHKSQGLGFKNVILSCFFDPSSKTMLSRKNIYTALTRAKEGLYVVGKKKAFEYAVANVSESSRKTNLSTLIEQAAWGWESEKAFLVSKGIVAEYDAWADEPYRTEVPGT